MMFNIKQKPLLFSVFVFSVVLVFYVTPAFGQNMSFTYFTKWGSLGKGNGQFDGQNDVDFYNGKVYVADYANHRVQIFDPSGNFIATFGSGGEFDGQFHKASALSTDNEGNLYIADQFNFRIQKFSSDGTFLGKWVSEGTADGQFLHPHVPANDC